MRGSTGAERTSCLIADDHDALRSGVAAVLRAEDDLTVVGEVADGELAVSMIERRRPDVAIVDLWMPGCSGVEICAALAARGLPTNVILYTGHDEPDALIQALDAGATGIVLKGSPMSDLLRAVRLAGNDQVYVDPVVAASLLRTREAPSDRLSPREREVLQLLSTGLSTPDVARTLFLSPGTVQDYAESAMRKLKARNRVHAVALAVLDQVIDGPADEAKSAA